MVTSHKHSMGKRAQAALGWGRHTGARRPGNKCLGIEALEERRVLAGGPVLAGITGDDGALLLGGEIKNTSPRGLTLTFDRGQSIDPATLNGIVLRSSGLDGGFTQGNEVTIAPGFIGLGESPNEIIIRFASTLPDDVYQLTIKGSGTTPLRNTAGEAFNMGVDFSQSFELDLGAKVVSVVTQPISRDSAGRLSQARNRIDVYFSNDDLDPTLATNPNFYQLFHTGHVSQFDSTFNSVSNADDGPPILPTSVTYDATLDRVVLTFRDDLSVLGVGTMRLRIGSDQAPLPVPLPTTIAADAGSSFGTASKVVGVLGAQDQILSSSIDPQALSVIFPGSNEDPGHRQVSSSFDFHVPDGGFDTVDGITTQSYNFRTFYGLGQSGEPLRNAITEAQKERAREAFELWGNWLGIKFVETVSDGFAIVTGDLRAIDADAITDPDLVQGAAGDVAGVDSNGNEFGETAVMSAAQRWNDGFGENWFREAMTQIGHLLDLGAATDLPAGTVMSSNFSLTFGRDGEEVYPGNHDIVHGQYLYRPDSIDIDLYEVNLDQDGIITVETMAERLGTPSSLDTFLRLYRKNGNVVELVAQNDDYFSQDSLISLALTAGTYYVGVSSKGNDRYDPNVADTGAGGTTQGDYQLRLHLDLTSQGVLRDRTGVAIDGDGDNTPGGAHHFWFRSQTASATRYVDKAQTAAGNGSLASPFNNLRDAMAAAAVGDIVRVVGNNFSDEDLRNDLPYQLGFGSFGEVLGDSTDDNGLLEIKRGVTLMVDAGAVFKLQGSSIVVGSTSSVVDRAGASLQILGVPGRPVRFTSYNDETIGTDLTSLTTSPRKGDWGGIVFRNDIDASLNRFDYEEQGIFLNTVSQAEIAYGGGFLSLDSVVGAANPITMIDSRPTVVFNTIRQSADAAMSASPDSFEETRFTDPSLQSVPFTLDFGRVGPDLHDNNLLLNTTNGLFVGNRFATSARGDALTGSARWNDVDIAHVLSDNLQIAGNSGGPVVGEDGILRARLDARLSIDPGMIVKLEGAHIDVGIGATLLAEGTATRPIVFTSIQDDRYGAGGSFDTNGDAVNQLPTAGDWGGIYLRPAARASIDRALVAFGGGITPIEGNFTAFNAIEAHQAELRVTRSSFESNASGFGGAADASRGGRTMNAPGTIYVSGAQPVVVLNRFLSNESGVLNIDVNSLNYVNVVDAGRQTGGVDRISGFEDNQGPLVRENTIGKNGLNAMEIRGGTVTTEVVWDDTDIVHVLREGVFVPNFHSFGGVRLKSAVDQSLVVKLSGAQAGFTTTGSATGIPDHIGGSLQVIGRPGYPVVMTSLHDDSVGAGFDQQGITQTDTNGGGRPSRKDNNRPFQID
ncbi:MAG TPA: DVUA0089 family protein, partial [Pirellulaceae bacterium]